MRFLWVLVVLFFFQQGFSQVERVEPPNWWVGFKDTSLQLLVKEDGIGNFSAEINYPGVILEKINKADSPNYLFLDLNISESAKPGKFDIVFKDENGSSKTYPYELKARGKLAEDYVGFNSSDVIYLITPDRFANANPQNDVDSTLLEKTIDRTNHYGRHGGDIQGITDHLDYIQEMGFTAVWPTPMLTNNMPRSSYHGYAITNFYEVDPRFGTLEEYKNLAATIHRKDMKLIMDMVANHCGVEH
ncbi:MAG: cyclomaltodextrinase N-terminal domain-containing protein, partial [Mangrovimonas sp.]|nr:cyclomaltodextrinase N-terminal domain-containing protein [Mangrovimonas sp.]